MKRKIVVAVLIVVVVFAGLAGVKALQVRKLIAFGAAFVPPPESVSAAVARAEKWQGFISSIGTIAAVQGVTVTPDIPGIVREIAFESGAAVAKDDLLVRLDTASEESQLRAVEAQAGLARSNLTRVRSLRTEGSVSQSDLDAAEAALKQYEANADTIRVTIEKKTIRAPFAGRLGIRQINVGQYLDLGKPIVSLQSLAPVYADFSLPQQELAKLKTGMRVRLSSDTYPGRQFEGVLSAINPDLDAVTRSVGLQAIFDNGDESLRPGMFARVEVLLPEEQNVLVIPATSVLSAPFGDSVYLIETRPAKDGAPPQLVVRQQFIRTGAVRGDFVSVESGLKPGDRVASSGMFKLRNGLTVVENNELTPKSTQTPNPADS